MNYSEVTPTSFDLDALEENHAKARLLPSLSSELSYENVTRGFSSGLKQREHVQGNMRSQGGGETGCKRRSDGQATSSGIMEP